MSFSASILVTGFPGFIAGRLVRRLASRETRFFLLVEERFQEKAVSEAAKIVSSCDLTSANFKILPGDITRRDLGLSPEERDLVLGECTDVFHLAAVYDLAVEKDVAYRVNVKGTENVNDIVSRARKLRRYNYVSTCYVAGKRDDRILETELEHGAGFRNYYEETKYFAESAVEKLKRSRPVTIFRPSVVCGDSETGETAKYDGIYYVIKFLLRFPEVMRLVNVGNDEVRLNLVPVDFVTEAMAALSVDPSAAGKTVALADPEPMTTREICDLIAESITNKRSVITPPAKVVEKFLSSPISPSLTGLPHSGVPYFFIPQTYDTRVAGELLAKHGIRCPSFPSYVRALVGYVEEHPVP